MENSLFNQTKKPKSKPQSKPDFSGNVYHSRKFSELHKINTKFVEFMHPKHEKAWQVYRKKLNRVSNFLDNNYHPNHLRAWYPNGKYQVKIRYNYTDSGLEHIYEKNNVEEKNAIDKEDKLKKGKYNINENFIEYKKASKGDYIIVIEYCSSCEEHSNITQHLSDSIYKDLAFKYQRIINERFPFIKVLLKPIDVDIVKNNEVELPKVEKNGGEYINTKSVNSYFKECRIGAFEIYISTVNNGTKIIHSKLKTKKFPNVDIVLNKIVSYLPKFNLNIILYDKEDYEDLDKMNNIQVNIYLCNSNIIKQVGKSTQEQVLNFTSPKRRLDMLRLQRLSEGQNFFKNGRSLFFNSRERIVSSIPSKNKRGFSPVTSYSFRPATSTQVTEPNNDIKKKLNNDNKDYEENENENNYDEKLLKSQRGINLMTKYSKVDDSNIKIEEDDRSESVVLKFENLSYDTYIIETVENCNFQSSLTLLKFNQINTESKEVKKFIGLWHQKKAILNIHLYMKKEESVSQGENGINNTQNKLTDLNVINDANITISKSDDPNSRYKVYPNEKGIYEYMTTPGEYKLEINKLDCERIVEKIKIQSGLNTKNIELTLSKHCDLEVQVLEYMEYSNEELIAKNLQKFEKKDDNSEISDKSSKKSERSNIKTEPVRNAEVQIFKNSNDLLVEGITNRKGIMKYLVDKNSNNLTIKVNKHGYFRAERFFKKNINMKENENGNYTCVMTFILVKKEILDKYNKVLFVLYTNMSKKIFNLNLQKYDDKEDDDFCHYYIKDMQKQNGILLTSLYYNPKKREDDEIILEENLNDDKKIEEQVKKEIKEKEKIEETKNDEDDFDENTYYKEIVRIGLDILPEVIKDENNSINMNDITAKDLIEYLRDICCEGNIYTSKFDFHINLPKFYNEKNIIETNSNINTNTNDNNTNNSQLASNQNQKKNFEGLYWDLGWLDLKNHFYYETSCNLDINSRPDRLKFFEKFVEFLQAFIDKKIYDSLFSFFGYNNSVLAGSDRYLPKKIFISILDEILIDENNHNKEKNEISTQREEENMKEKKNFMEYICNILCGYDEEMNIRDDSISYNLLRKKISSNLKNFNGIN